MKEIVKLEAYNIEQLVNLSGVKDENLEVLEDHFQVEISLRGDEMSIVGSQQQIEKTKKVIYPLLKLIVSGVSISRRDVIYAQKLVEKDKLDQLSELYKGELEASEVSSLKVKRPALESGLKCYEYKGSYVKTGLKFIHLVYFDDKNTYVYGYEANRKDFRKNLKKMIVYLESFTKSSGL